MDRLSPAASIPELARHRSGARVLFYSQLTQGSSARSLKEELNRGVQMEKPSRKSFGVRNPVMSTQSQVQAMEPGMSEHSLYKREAGGSIPSPATIKKFRPFEVRWAERVGLPECPYLVRWSVTVYGYSIRLHKWLASDDQRFPHDHAWDYCSVVLKGLKVEHTDGGFRVQSFGQWRYHKAEEKHTVEIIRHLAPTWTLLFTGKPRKQWGFYVPGREKLLRPLRYFSRYGHHPCD